MARRGTKKTTPSWLPGPELRLDALVILVTAAVFGRSVRFPFVNWDDPLRIINQPWIVDPASRSLFELVLTPELGYPQPLTALSQSVDWWLGGGAAWPFHLTNVALHITNALLVRRLAMSYGIRGGWSSLAALVFAVHPIVVEPVCWATGRKDVLATFGVLVGFLAYRRGCQQSVDSTPTAIDRRMLALILLGFLIAIGAKPTGIVLVPLIVSDLILHRRWPDRSLAATVATGTLISVAVVVVSYRLHDAIAGLDESRELAASAAYASQHLALQVRNVAYPMRLAPLYFEPLPAPLYSVWGVAGIAVVAGLLAACLIAFRRAVPVAFGIAWVLIAFLPTSGLIPLVRGPADSYFYLPWAGAAVALGALVERYARRRSAITGAASAALTVWSILAWSGTERFASSAELWRPLVTLYPDQPSSHQNYGDGLIADGRVADAVPHLSRALELTGPFGNDPTGLEMVALACAAIGDLRCATRWLAEAARRFSMTERRAWLLAGAAATGADPRYVADVKRARERVRAGLGSAHSPDRRRRERRNMTTTAVECQLARAALRSMPSRSPGAGGGLEPELCAQIR